VPAPFRRQVDEGILDRAAGLMAAHGVAKTSVQDVADAVGLSKAGLLHHYPTKDALHRAVRHHAVGLGRDVLAEVTDLPLGPDRDRRTVERVVDVALSHPGMVALLLSPAGAELDATADPDGDELGGATAGEAVLEAFGLASDAPETVSTVDAATAERTVRVLGALGALALLSVTAHAQDRPAAWRPGIVATCLDALGAPTGTPDLPRPTHPETVEV
jgi:AcrR family transcriptional regulator